MKCISKQFGTTAQGEEVMAYTLSNSKGASVTVLNYGGIIQSLKVPDSKGNVENIVLGFNSVEAYEKDEAFFGALCGRTAGRIANASFEIDGESFTLDANQQGNTLHGGDKALNRRIWEVAEVVGEDRAELALSYTSPHLDLGYPGTLDMVVNYAFDENNDLTITYRATTDAATILTLTNHSYFNLSGDYSAPVTDHVMTIPADKVMVLGEGSIPTSVAEVENGPFDFREGKAIGQDIEADDANLAAGAGYDHPFVLNKEDGEKILLSHPGSGRNLTITTSEQCVVCYTANFLSSDVKVYDDRNCVKRGAVCLETQYYPDAVNADFIPSRILRPGEIYLEETTYSFGVEE